jgi:RIO1 family
MDVHVTVSCTKGVGVYEGPSRCVSLLTAELKSSRQVLHEHQFPVPRPIDQARHCILMEFIDAYPLWVKFYCRLMHTLHSYRKGVRSTRYLLLENSTLS